MGWISGKQGNSSSDAGFSGQSVQTLRVKTELVLHMLAGYSALDL